MNWKWFFVGAFSLLIAIGILGLIYLKTEGMGARSQPGRIETALAMQARKLAMPEEARSLTNPTKDTPEVLADARAHWADHCAICHSNDGSGTTPMGLRMYPPAPDMRQPRTQQWTDGELFYIIENGIRLTGMPAWGAAGHGTEDSWKLVRFIRHLPQITAPEIREMDKLNPKSPDELKEEQEEKDFLNGEPHEPEPHKHH